MRDTIIILHTEKKLQTLVAKLLQNPSKIHQHNKKTHSEELNMKISSCKAQGKHKRLSVSARKQSKLVQKFSLPTLHNATFESARDMCCPRVSYQRQIFHYRHFLTLNRKGRDICCPRVGYQRQISPYRKFLKPHCT
jgi:hypothetical protein